MLLLGFGTVLRRWKDKRPYWNTDSPLPDPETLNKEIPIEEWEFDLAGNRTPPWKLCYVFYLVNVNTGRLHTFAHDTYGTLLCYEAIKEQCFVKQWLTGTFVMPIVDLGKAPWKSTIPWEDSPPPSTPTPAPPTAAPKLAPAYPPAAQSAAAAAAKAAAAQSPLLAKTKPATKTITVAESIDDELPPHSAPPKDDKGWR